MNLEAIHYRTGSLERQLPDDARWFNVHYRTGSLEKLAKR